MQAVLDLNGSLLTLTMNGFTMSPCTLRRHLHKLKIVDDAEYIEAGEETFLHLLTNCGDVSVKRPNFFGEKIVTFYHFKMGGTSKRQSCMKFSICKVLTLAISKQ